MAGKPDRTYRRRGRSEGLTGERAFWLLCAFAALVFLMGGGSRADILSLGPLRAVAAVLLAVAAWYQTPRTLRRVAVPALLLVLLALLMALQLIPLPPSWWQALPDRQAFAQLGELTGQGDVWRPLTFSPMKTANSLASLVVPLAGLGLVALMDDEQWRRLPWLFIVAGVASALFGMAQMLLPGAHGLYLYAMTNEGSAVGLFSNRNHNAMFLTVALLLCVLQLERARRGAIEPQVLAAGLAGLVILAGIMINASRSGLLGLGLVGLIFAARALWHWRDEVRRGARGIPLRFTVGGAVGALSLALVGTFLLLGRSPALTRLLQHDVADDLRVQALPTVWQMLADQQALGVGFGAFEYAFRLHEPEGMMGPRYFNNAHNDWLQFPLEGGWMAVGLGLLALALFGRRCWHLLCDRTQGDAMQRNAVAGALVLVLLLLASVVDYPLRTPSIMLLAALAAAMVFKPNVRRVAG